MTVRASGAERTGNRILTALPSHEQEALMSACERLDLARGTVIITAGAVATHTYLLESGLSSLIVATPDGRSAEVAVGGSESIAPAPATLWDGTAQQGDIIMQQAGSVLRLPVPRFTELLASLPAFSAFVDRFQLAWYDAVAQNAACNAQHNVERRFARWMLLALDRVGGDRLALTHEFIGLMLAVRRATVTVVAEVLRDAGAIDYRYGAIAVRDRAALEERACPCYALMRDATEAALSRA